MDIFLPLLKDSPWIFLSLVGLWLVYKALVWIGKRLFDEEKGIITGFLSSHKSFLESLERTNAGMLNQWATTGLQVQQLERKIEQAFTARHSDPELWRILFEENPVPQAMVSKDGIYIQINHALCLLLGYTSPELLRMSWRKITPDAEVAGDEEAGEELIEGTRTFYRIEKHYTRKDASLVAVTLYAFRYPKTGPFSHAFAIMIPREPGRL